MKKLAIITLLAATFIGAGAPQARAGWLHTNAVAVAAGQTNAVVDIPLAQPLSRNEAPALSCVSVENVSGYGTGTVTFASVDFGHEMALANVGTVSPGVSSDIWPKHAYVPHTTTNAEPYMVRLLRVRVVQQTTNSTPTVYRIGAITQ